MPWPSPASPLVRAKIRSYGAAWMPVFHVFSPLMTHSSPSRTAVVSMCVASEPCVGLGDAEREAAAAFGEGVDPLRLLLLGAVVDHQQQPDVVADDRVLVLQVAVQAEALAREVLADHGHAEVRAVLAAVLLRERVAVVAGGVGAAPRLAQQRFPLLVRQPAAVPVGARVLAAVVEEADVVVGCSSGMISRSMKSSSSTRYAARSGGSSKSMANAFYTARPRDAILGT